MTASSRSADVYNAVKFLRDVHRDVATLIESVDSDLDERGWERTERNRVSSDLTNALDPNWWIIQYVSRFYVPRGVANATSTILFSVVFLPEAHDYSIAFCVGAKLASPLPRENLWRGWKDARRFLKALNLQQSGEPVDPDILGDGLIPGAAYGVAAFSPLLELETMDKVRDRLLRPALDALRP
jgi:hypothetical protein